MEDKKLRNFQKSLLKPTLEEAKNYGHSLDYSVDSLSMIDDILNNLHLEYQADENREKTEKQEAYSGLAMCYASYIIEVIEKANGKGELRHPEAFYKDDVFPLFLGGKLIMPYNWVIKKIFDGGNDNIVRTYKAINFDKKNRNIFSIFKKLFRC